MNFGSRGFCFSSAENSAQIHQNNGKSKQKTNIDDNVIQISLTHRYLYLSSNRFLVIQAPPAGPMRKTAAQKVRRPVSGGESVRRRSFASVPVGNAGADADLDVVLHNRAVRDFLGKDRQARGAVGRPVHVKVVLHEEPEEGSLTAKINQSKLSLIHI